MRDNLSQVKGIKPEGDKIMRMAAQTAMIENGFVHLPKDAAWLPAYVQELTIWRYYPATPHPDRAHKDSPMSAKLIGHVIVEVGGEEHYIEARSFTEEHDGLWKYDGDGYSLQVTANLEGAVDAEGNYPTFLEEPEVDGNVLIEIIDSEIAAARGDLFEIDEDEDDDNQDEDEDSEDR